jgi:ATP-dependent Lon protease
VLNLKDSNFNKTIKEDKYDKSETVDLNSKLNIYFSGKVVRKDLTKKIKEGANVPVYVLEYLLGKYTASDDEFQIKEGVRNVRNILAENFVRPDEAQKVISKIREIGSYTVIDKVSVKLNYKYDRYEAEFSNLGLKGVPIAKKFPNQYERLLGGDIWCMVNFEYFFDEGDLNRNPFIINKLSPIQMPNLDLSEILDLRTNFTKDEWIDSLLRSCGMEPTQLDKRVKWLLLARLVPLVENNFNLCELGPRSTGKSHVYKEISPNSILVSGGKTTVANLFYNMSTRLIGLVGMWDCVAFDEVAGIKFKDNDGIAIMKDYMASGSFSRGKDEKNASASMVFVGNINQSVDSLLKTSSLFAPFPDEINKDTAFFDRMHCYIPGWEIPKFRPEHFTNDYGFITDYLAEFMREMRKRSLGNAFDEFFKLGNDLNQRDTIAVRKMVSGLVKLIYPDEKYNKEDIREILVLALECRRRVKEQLKKIGGMEFYDINFSYIDIETNKEEWVGIKEQSSGKLIPEGTTKPGHLFTVGPSSSGHLGVFKIETEVNQGSGKFKHTGIGSSKEVREAVDTAFNYLKSNSQNVSASISTKTKDYLMEIQDLNGIGMTKNLALPAFVALCSAALEKPILSSTAVLGSLSIGGTLIKVDDLSNTLQSCLDNGAKKVLLPISSTVDLATVPPELVGKFSLIFYQSPEDAVFKALGAE